jgi:hypothetical protein
LTFVRGRARRRSSSSSSSGVFGQAAAEVGAGSCSDCSAPRIPPSRPVARLQPAHLVLVLDDDVVEHEVRAQAAGDRAELRGCFANQSRIVASSAS